MGDPSNLLGPREILALDPAGADRLLDELERSVPVRETVVSVPLRPDADAVVFGDTHGDWPSTMEVVGLLDDHPDRYLIGLGDYVDRPPPDLPHASVANALYLLQLTARQPDRVYLIQGNHETVDRIPLEPRTLPREVLDLWGPGGTRVERIAALLERGPLAITTESGAYLAHAGFPRGRLDREWRTHLEPIDERRLLEMVWSECTASRSGRGGIEPWGAGDLARFLADSSLTIVLRGHDPDLTGRRLYDDRCLTLQTTRIYERFGGVIAALLPLGRPVASLADLTVRHLSTEGRRYDPGERA